MSARDVGGDAPAAIYVGAKLDRAGATNALGAIALNSTGTTTLGGTATAASLTTNAGGTTVLNGTISTSGAQSYNDAVLLNAAAALLLSDATIVARCSNARRPRCSV